jgi:hypothetical protein
MKKTILFLSVVFLLSSCASIFTGSKRRVLFETNPSGAKIYVNGFEKGKTPSQIKVAADDRVDFRLEGFNERVVVMDSKFNLVAILNGLSIIGWGVDAITGSLKRVDTKYVKVDLEKANPNNEVAKYLKKGKVKDVKINTIEGTIETTIILN